MGAKDKHRTCCSYSEIRRWTGDDMGCFRAETSGDLKKKKIIRQFFDAFCIIVEKFILQHDPKHSSSFKYFLYVFGIKLSLSGV